MLPRHKGQFVKSRLPEASAGTRGLVAGFRAKTTAAPFESHFIGSEDFACFWGTIEFLLAFPDHIGIGLERPSAAS